ncbi:site-specific integrase [Cellulomonas hominis]|uniref:Site-specific integrase n=1 Tax=Cellulomonas hominis TaxID=156981 RepID=A0A7Z8K1S9_9CELL|nr:site-specific integrase [Cellulomonas hominis]TKR27168.1 site-specific integrase [Cellulomonas hominis]
MASVEDRWWSRDAAGRRVRTERYGTGLRWRATWHEDGGARRRRSFPTKDAAQAHLEDVGASQRAGTYVSPDRGAITVAEMAERWYRAQVHQRASSLEAVRRRLDRTVLPTLGSGTLADLDRSAVQDAVTEWSTRLAPGTVRNAYVYLAGVCSLAVEERRIVSTPCRRINLPPDAEKLIDPLPIGKVQDLVDALWVPYRPMAALIVASGVRPGEARGLTGDRVVPIEGGARVRIDRQMVSRNSCRPEWGPLKTPASYRTLSIGAVALEQLGPLDDGLVLTTGQGRVITRGMASSAWRAAAAKVGLPTGSGWHDLRHFHASKLIAGGSSPRAVASRLGHKDPTETLRTYAHLWPDDDDRMRDATDGLIVLPDAA